MYKWVFQLICVWIDYIHALMFYHLFLRKSSAPIVNPCLGSKTINEDFDFLYFFLLSILPSQHTLGREHTHTHTLSIRYLPLSTIRHGCMSTSWSIGHRIVDLLKCLPITMESADSWVGCKMKGLSFLLSTSVRRPSPLEYWNFAI